ncbi:MAG: NADH-quinone oxidoreductase subunit C [Egibacteraceae bacterium]
MPTVRSSETTPPATRLSPEAIGALLAERLPEAVTATTVAHGQLTVDVVPSHLPRVAALCKREKALGMDFFDMMAGVDAGEDGFAVVTRLYSTRHRHEVLLRALAEGGREAPRLPTLTAVYRGANWHEREAYDMYGITFEGHPGLEPRILTVENFEGWPLRKDFLLTTREIKPWPGEKVPKAKEEPAKADDGGEGAEPGPSEEERAAAKRAKAERAKQKAAEMRAKKRAQREAEAGGAQRTTDEGPPQAGGTTGGGGDEPEEGGTA